MAPRRVLDIIIVTLHSRAHLYERTINELHRQIEEAGLGEEVHVITEIDDGALSIGEKRNVATRKTAAEYVMHMDDDDAFSETLVRDVVDAIGPGDVDCIGVRHLIRMVNGVWQKAELSSRHKRKHHEGGTDDATRTYCVPATHMNPIRRSIMMRFPFPHIDKGEDVKQAINMGEAGVLKTERMIEKPLYFYVPSWLQRKGVPSGIRPPE